MAIESRLLRYLQSGVVTTQAEAAKKLGVSRRSARRYLARLEKRGWLEVHRDGATKRYRLKEEHFPAGSVVPKFTDREAQALTVACLASRALLRPTPFANALKRAHGKFEQTWLAEAMSFDAEDEPGRWSFEGAAGGEPPPFDRACFTDLLEAVRNTRPVVVTYFTAYRSARSENRRLHPLGFHVRAGSWMLAAFDPDDDCVKDFSLAGFEKVEILENETFAPPDDFDLTEHTAHRFRALAGEGDHTVRLEVTAEAAPYFDRKTYHPTQIKEKTLADGSAVVSFEVEGLDDIASWVRSWGPKVKVLEPEALAERVREDATEVAELYR